MRRRLIASAVILATLGAAPIAHADPPAATDYHTTIVAITPPTASIHPAIIAGDSFFELAVDRGTAVDVLGYRGEAYLRFLTTGEVLENRRSMSYFANRSRLGSAVPDDITADATPEWHTVGRDGRYAWHDHRTHWMNTRAPLGARRGDAVLDASVPLVVDGRPVSVSVRGIWEPPPSSLPWVLGALVGVGLVALVWRRRQSATTGAAVALLVSAAATMIGAWQYLSVPTETGPSKLSIVLPAVAAVAAALALLIASRRRPTAVGAGLVLLGAIELALWAWARRAHLHRAILPTAAPWWLDRAVTAAAMVTAIALAAQGVARLAKRY